MDRIYRIWLSPAFEFEWRSQAEESLSARRMSIAWMGNLPPHAGPREMHKEILARQQHSWVQREEVSSRQDAKNAKESTILFQPINDGSDSLLFERLAEIEHLVLDFPWSTWRLGEIQKDSVPE